MSWRMMKFFFFLLLSLLTCLAMYLLVTGVPYVSEATVQWDHPRLFDIAKLIDENPMIIVVFFGVIALAMVVTALMYLATPIEQRMIRYTTSDSEVLVNLDTIASSLQNILEEEHDVETVKVVLRVPSGKQLRIKCFIRLELMEQPDIPRRVEMLRERVRTHFEQALPLEAKFSTSVELKIVPALNRRAEIVEERPKEKPFVNEFQGPRYPVE